MTTPAGLPELVFLRERAGERAQLGQARDAHARDEPGLGGGRDAAPLLRAVVSAAAAHLQRETKEGGRRSETGKLRSQRNV